MTVHHFETLGSTNEQLAGMAEEGAPEWTVVTADRQTSGRGRQNRNWWSPEGNLHMSILMRPKVSPRELTRLPVIASLAFVSAMGTSGTLLSIKWPNDIILNGRKLAGILVESRTEGSTVSWAVVGFGVNMAPAVDDVPKDLKNRMAFVHEVDNSQEPDGLALRIVSGMKEWSGAMTGEGWVRAMDQWSRRALLNTSYTLRDGGREIIGIPRRLDDMGGLVMETKDGEVVVYSGEIEAVQSPES